jgi:flagellar biosynthesis protein FlhA
MAAHADELMTHEQVNRLLDRARSTSPVLVAEVVPALLRVGEIQRVLQNLLRERVGVRDLETILEALAEHASKTRDTDLLTELVRQTLSRRIVQPYLGRDGRLRVVRLARSVENRLAAAGSLPDSSPASALGPETTRGVVHAVAAALVSLVEEGLPPIVLCSAEARLALKDLTRTDLPRLVVLSTREVPRDVQVETLGTVVEEEMPAIDQLSTSYATH